MTVIGRRGSAATAETVLRISGLGIDYQTRAGVRSAVNDITLELAAGEILALVGESGSGKSTIGHAVLGLLPPNGRVTGGTISVQGHDLAAQSARELRSLRGAAIGFVPQDPTLALDPVRRVGDQVEDPLIAHTQLDRRARRQRVRELFELVGLHPAGQRVRQYPHELSGGMRQRVLIAAALAAEPAVIVADEPTSGLDTTVQAQVLDLIDDLRHRIGTAVLLITHDLGVAADRADRIAVLHRGTVVENGPAVEVVDRPRAAYTRHLLASLPAMIDWQRPAPRAAAPAVEARGLSKAFGATVVVDGIDLRVERGSTLAIVGESGSGKSTTARLLAGLLPATAGSIRLLGTDIAGMRPRELHPLRREVQFVHQNPFASFDPRFDVFSVVEEPLQAFEGARPRGAARRARRDQVAAVLESVALPADTMERHPRELSGGQRQRVAIARALVLHPSLIILDEPVSALDVSVQAQVLRLLLDLQRERQLTYVFISHDLSVVRAISDHVAVMVGGRIVESGPTAEVFANPTSVNAVELLDSVSGRSLLAPSGTRRAGGQPV